MLQKIKNSQCGKKIQSLSVEILIAGKGILVVGKGTSFPNVTEK